MEGIRQEEIAPLLDRWFTPEKVFYYDAYMRLLCTNATLGPRLDPDKGENRKMLESLIDEEMEAIASGKAPAHRGVRDLYQEGRLTRGAAR